MKEVVVLDEAASDIESAAAFYELVEQGVGEYFVQSILQDLRSLGRFPGVHRVNFGFHRALCSQFPFALYYRDDGRMRRVAAVLDLRRNPDAIRGFLKDR